jgi:protein phosphatase
MKLYITIGISGSGKSTFLKEHFNPEGIVNPDELRKFITGDISDQTCNNFIFSQMVPVMLEARMKKYNYAVLDATSVDSKLRGQLLEKFPEIETIALVFFVEPKEAFKRVRKDIKSNIDRSDVPEHVIIRQYKKFVEGFADIYTQFDKVVLM